MRSVNFKSLLKVMINNDFVIVVCGGRRNRYESLRRYRILSPDTFTATTARERKKDEPAKYLNGSVFTIYKSVIWSSKRLFHRRVTCVWVPTVGL